LDGEAAPDACRLANSRTAARSLSLHRLFRTDDSDDFFGMIILPVNVYDQQHGSHIRSEANFAERVPALLSGPDSC